MNTNSFPSVFAATLQSFSLQEALAEYRKLRSEREGILQSRCEDEMNETWD